MQPLVTDGQRDHIANQLRKHWLIAWVLPTWKMKPLIGVTERVLSDKIYSSPGSTFPVQSFYDQRREMIREVKNDPQVKEFLDLILLTAIGWIIGKILDALWDQWTLNMFRSG